MFRSRFGSGGIAQAPESCVSITIDSQSLQFMWREEDTRGSSSLRHHQALECSAKHLGIDGRFFERCRLLTSGEPVPREQLAEEPPDRLILKAQRLELLLDARRGEQSAVEKWNPPKG